MAWMPGWPATPAWDWASPRSGAFCAKPSPPSPPGVGSSRTGTCSPNETQHERRGRHDDAARAGDPDRSIDSTRHGRAGPGGAVLRSPLRGGRGGHPGHAAQRTGPSRRPRQRADPQPRMGSARVPAGVGERRPGPARRARGGDRVGHRGSPSAIQLRRHGFRAASTGTGGRPPSPGVSLRSGTGSGRNRRSASGAQYPGRPCHGRRRRVRRPRGRGRTGPRRACRRGAGGAREPAAGGVDRATRGSPRVRRGDRRRGVVRLSRPTRAEGARMGTAASFRMDIPTLRRTAPAMAALPRRQSALPVEALGGASAGAALMSAVEVLARSALTELWKDVAARGWCPPSGSRILVQVAGAHRGARVVETARSLVAFLVADCGASTIEVTGGCLGDGWAPARIRDLAAEASFAVAGVALPRGVIVPSAWFQDLHVVTIAGVGPDRRARMAGVLGAQAEVLTSFGNPRDPEALTFEAHRLAASDLAIACGDERGGWWVAGSDDVGVDLALAEAAGASPKDMPWLRSLARHEVLPNVRVDGSLPTLRSSIAPWPPAAALVVARSGRAVARGLIEDARALRRNLGKVPHALARRLAAVRRRGRAA